MNPRWIIALNGGKLTKKIFQKNRLSSSPLEVPVIKMLEVGCIKFIKLFSSRNHGLGGYIYSVLQTIIMLYIQYICDSCQ